ncbi:MAG: transposase, partial [Acidobacteria bacterium]|nr:transposase [Acidobacteriota bacterium]
MKKTEETQPVGAAEGGRRPTVAAPTGRGGKGRFSSQRKAEAVLRLLRGEELDALSRELGVMAATLAGWKEAFLGAGLSGLKSRDPDSRDEEIARLKQLLGDREMRLE